MSDPLIQRYAHDGWLEVALNRPERKNAVIGPMVEELITALDAADRDEGVRVVLLRGEGGAFCSGLDLKEFNADPAPDWLPEFSATWRRLHERIYVSGTPIVGALERYAINGGAALALASDLLVCGETAFLQCVPDDAVLEEARALTAQLASHPAGALARVKPAIRSYAAADAKEWFDRAFTSDPLRRFAPAKAKP